MARRRTPIRGTKIFEKYPGLYARTGDTWNNRSGQRDTKPEFNLYGLNTAVDTIHKEAGESPFLTNIRWFGEKEGYERAQVMSRAGARYLGGKEQITVERPEADGNAFIDLYEGKMVRYHLNTTGITVMSGIIIRIQNTESAKGFLRISLRDRSNQKELSNGVVNLENISPLGFTRVYTRMIVGVDQSDIDVVMDILDDVDPDNCYKNPEPYKKRSIRILSTGESNHEVAEYALPNTDKCMKQKKVEWCDGVSSPLTGYTGYGSSTLPRLHRVCAKGIDYFIYPVKNSDGVKLYRTRIDNGETTELDSPVWSGTTAVRGEQAEGFFYYVDGNSALQRINLTTWVTELAVPAQSEIGIVYQNDLAQAQTELTAKAGASLILYHQNRLYLSGFKDDPNIIHFSLIDGTAPRVDQFNVTNRFYSSDNAPEDTSCDPISAMASLNDNVVIFRRESLSLFTLSGGFDYGSPQQVTPEGNRYGVLNQEAVAYGRNVVYFYNPTEGVMRFAGAMSKVESLKIDNILNTIPEKNKSSVFLEYFDLKLRVYYSIDHNYNDRCLIMYTSFSKPSPWYMDINTPVRASIGTGSTDKLYALHSQYPIVYEVDATNQLTDFNSIIEAEYHTAYKATRNPFGWERPRRIFAMVLANSTNSYYLGIDYDYKDNPSVWRKFVDARVDSSENEYAVMKHTAEAGIKSVQATVNGICHFYQLRIKAYCYRSRFELVGLNVETGFKNTL